MPEKSKIPNELIHESSPYLLQHAYNPVKWLPFGKEAFEKAERENKLVLVSVGYSACHWCHVMEHESFEDAHIAEIMNRHFVCIKVDREERSDVDMLYMQAVQLMTGHGGWPLNCFALPDGRPVYGGTYFPRQQWANVLMNLADLYKNDRDKVLQYAENLTDGIRQSELITTAKKQNIKVNREALQSCVTKWKQRFDDTFGGPDKAPKFPLPNNYRFLIRYALLEKDEQVLEHVHLTLRKMACGGIYDQVHGGFARYSTDILWKVPHFEKMLYDNAQLVSLYAEAYQHSKNGLYKQIVEETLSFIEREWFNEKGFFFSAFDADSEGEEGKYYVWKKEDLEALLEKEYDLFSDYYHIDELGYWENENYILMRNENLASLRVKFNLTSAEMEKRISACREILRRAAQKRVKPGLDDKTLTSWNAMTCSAFAQAYLVFGNEKYREIALKSLNFILSELKQDNGKLWRTYKNGQSKINGFLDDYAFVIEALMNVYLITQEERYLLEAKKLTEFTLKEFNNPASDFLFYTDNISHDLVSRGSEISDNVIPASNSQMALNLFYIGTYFDLPEYVKRSQDMLNNLSEELRHYGGGYSNWGCLALYFNYSFKEVAIVGKAVNEKLLDLHQHGFTNAILAVNSKQSSLPLLKDRYVENETLIYVCENKSCKLPVTTIHDALEQIT